MQIFKSYLMMMLVFPGGLVALTEAELGKWWKNSQVVSRLQLTPAQVGQIEQRFLEHQRPLADANGQLKKQEAHLKALMENDPLVDAKVQAQIERVASARATLEKTNAAMMLAIRKALSREQWKKLGESQTVPISAAGARIPAAPGPKAEKLPEGVYIAGNGVQAPVVLYQRLPPYTQAARDAKAEGIVLLEAIVRKDGSIDTVKVLRGVGYGLDESAMNAIAREWKFQPGTLNGKPVDVKITVETSFRLY
jgi:TonB family protein